MTTIQQQLWPDHEVERETTTFGRSLAEPIHGWFRFSAGFSAPWVRQIIAGAAREGRTRVLDPFAGSGTVLIEAERCGAESIGIEAHPFAVQVALAKLQWRQPVRHFLGLVTEVQRRARELESDVSAYPTLIHRCYPEDTLRALDQLRRAVETLDPGDPATRLVWLALASILRDVSPVGTASWQYVLPKKRKASSAEPFAAFEAKAQLMARDMRVRQSEPVGPEATLIETDARRCQGVPDGWATLVITSPPYANNFDYADFTRLELSFFLVVRQWRDLHAAVRDRLVRSCTQHVAVLPHTLEEVVSSHGVAPIRQDLLSVCRRLTEEKGKHRGKKPYDLMVASYFADLADCLRALRRCTAAGGRVCFVVGDSAPYGVHVPVERWLGELAVALGFLDWSFEKVRDRNTKWLNRKHRVPLQEGRLWIRA